MAMGCINHNGVNTGLYQAFTALYRVFARTHRCRYPQPALEIFAGVREFGLLLDVHDRDQPLQVESIIDQ